MKELALIADIQKRAGKMSKGVKLGIGDDCAVLDHDKTSYLLWAADMLIDGTHFRVGKDPYNKIGRKAVAVNISDIAAMGGLPKYIIVSIGVPKNMNLAAIRAIYSGIFGICKEYGIKVVGGDTNRSGKLVIDVSVLGRVGKKLLVTRSGAKEKELILITGPVRNGKKEHLTFDQRLQESKFLTGRYKVTSMIDTSDGIAMDIGRICRESNTGCRLYAAAMPLSKGLTLEDALYYGESFELLFTMRDNEAHRLLRGMNASGYSVIGEITHKRKGLRLIDRAGRSSVLSTEGYRHLGER